MWLWTKRGLQIIFKSAILQYSLRNVFELAFAISFWMGVRRNFLTQILLDLNLRCFPKQGRFDKSL